MLLGKFDVVIKYHVYYNSMTTTFTFTFAISVLSTMSYFIMCTIL